MRVAGTVRCTRGTWVLSFDDAAAPSLLYQNREKRRASSPTPKAARLTNTFPRVGHESSCLSRADDRRLVLRATNGAFPVTADLLEGWGAFKAVTTAFLEDGDEPIVVAEERP